MKDTIVKNPNMPQPRRGNSHSCNEAVQTQETASSVYAETSSRIAFPENEKADIGADTLMSAENVFGMSADRMPEREETPRLTESGNCFAEESRRTCACIVRQRPAEMSAEGRMHCSFSLNPFVQARPNSDWVRKREAGVEAQRNLASALYVVCQRYVAIASNMSGFLLKKVFLPAFAQGNGLQA